MKFKARLTILFTILTATILLAFAAVIYYTAKESREREFYALLEKEALTKANLFLNARVDKQTLQDIYLNNRKILNEVEVAIYDTSFHLLYHDAVEIDFVKETKQMIDEINAKGKVRFYLQNWQVIGVRYVYDGATYIVTATALDQYGYTKLESLLKTIVLVFVIAIVFINIAGHFFSKRAFEPVVEMTQKAANISVNNLDLRLDTGGGKDELSELANTFNSMLDRLEKSFDAQKHFVSNISHELRTPLAAIIAELELTLNRERTVSAYQNAIGNSLNDARRLNRLSNSLLDLAKASYDPSEIAFKTIRIDELLLDAQQQVQKANAVYKVAINFDADFESDSQISVSGNAYLLKVALINLLENGCKFSNNKQCTVFISFGNDRIVLRFVDKGIGIPEEELKSIFSPFFRGQNQSFAEGNGIGLSLTKKIILLHQGTITVSSNKGEGTTFMVDLPLIKI